MESISIKIDRDIGIVKRALKRAVFPKQTKIRGKLYIKERIENAYDYLEIMTNQLKMCAQNYVFKFRCVLTADMIGKCSTFDLQVGEILRLTRTNGNCALNGYREQWLYPCVCNK